MAGTGGSTTGNSTLFQYRRGYPDCQRIIDGKGRVSGNRAGLYDVGSRSEPAENDHLAAGTQAAAHCHLRRHGGGDNHDYRLFV